MPQQSSDLTFIHVQRYAMNSNLLSCKEIIDSSRQRKQRIHSELLGRVFHQKSCVCGTGVHLLPLADPAEISLCCCTYRTETHAKNFCLTIFLLNPVWRPWSLGQVVRVRNVSELLSFQDTISFVMKSVY